MIVSDLEEDAVRDTNTRSAADDWSAVASAWDSNVAYIESHSAALTLALIETLDVRAGDRVLELAAGPGTLGERWSELTGAGGTVVLSDVAPGMVEAACRRNARQGNVEVSVLDASCIDRPSGSFDIVACRMGLMFTPDPAVAFGEIRRILAPGGRFGALTWAGPEHNPWMTCVGMAAMMNGLVFGGLPVGPGGIFSLGAPTELAALSEAAGLVDVAVTEIPITFDVDSINSHIERVSSLAGPLAAAFAAADPERLAAVRRTAAQLTVDYTTSDGLALPGRALLVSGRA
jgi:ubiquinone/menaquinone biosynthesis C-methylase UbiE